MEPFHWSLLLGGFAFFFLGLRQAHRALQAVAGERMRSILTHLTSNRITGLIFGAIVTIILQSSGATSVMLVSFAETQLLNLTQAAAVLFGADIGTTFTVFLLSIQKMSEYALVVVAVGFLWEVLSGRGRGRHIGSVILGFGLLFYGMDLMSSAATPLKESPIANDIFAYLAGHPFGTLLFAIVISSALHSAGTIGIAIALAFSGTISLAAAIPIVLGANVGSCVTTILSGLGSNIDGKRVAAVHTLSKVIGVLLIFPFLAEATTLVDSIGVWIGERIPQIDPGVVGRIVIAHVLFNTALAIFFLPLLSPLVWLIRRILPEPVAGNEVFRPKYLDSAALDTPALAFAQVKREIMRLGGIVEEQLQQCLRMFHIKNNTDVEVEMIETDDDKIDLLEKAIRFYLAKLSSENLSEEEAKRQLALLTIGQDLEEIGDTISKEMVALARKKASKHTAFSEEGWSDLRRFHKLVHENFILAMSILTQQSEELVAKVMRHEHHMGELEQEFRQAHLSRLQQGDKESFDTSSIHLDILSALRRISGKATHIVQMTGEL